MDFKALQEAGLLDRGHHRPNDPENADQAPVTPNSSHKKKQGSDIGTQARQELPTDAPTMAMRGRSREREPGTEGPVKGATSRN